MLREDYVRYAAAVHIDGARFLRDTVAAMLPCYAMNACKSAFGAASLLSRCEAVMDKAIGLSVGLMEKNGLTKYTAVIEARMRLMGTELSGALTQKQINAARASVVPPGTRGNVYDGFVSLSSEAEKAAAECVAAIDESVAAMREGRAAFAVPVTVLLFLKRLCADYSALCRKLAAGERAEFLKRQDEFDKCLRALCYAAATEGVEASSSADALAALSSSGLIPSLPPVLFDILLRYEDLPVAGAD